MYMKMKLYIFSGFAERFHHKTLNTDVHPWECVHKEECRVHVWDCTVLGQMNPKFIQPI